MNNQTYRQFAVAAITAVFGAVLAFGVLVSSSRGVGQDPPGITIQYMNHKCFAAGICPLGPNDNPLCPAGALANQSCYACESNAVMWECHPSTGDDCGRRVCLPASDCGIRWPGLCLGPGLACILFDESEGRCGRVVCGV